MIRRGPCLSAMRRMPVVRTCLRTRRTTHSLSLFGCLPSTPCVLVYIWITTVSARALSVLSFMAVTSHWVAGATEQAVLAKVESRL